MALINPSPIVVSRKDTSRECFEAEAGKKDGDRNFDFGTKGGERDGQKEVGLGVAELFRFVSRIEREQDAEKDIDKNERLRIRDDFAGDKTSNGTLNDDSSRERVDALEIFEHIRDIRDPEHPYTLEQLSVVREEHIFVEDLKGTPKTDRLSGSVRVQFTPTVMHCSMATLIGLSIRVKLMRVLHPRFKVDIRVSPGSHASEMAVNKQLNDKERVCAALENPNLIEMVDKCISNSD